MARKLEAWKMGIVLEKKMRFSCALRVCPGVGSAVVRMRLEKCDFFFSFFEIVLATFSWYPLQQLARAISTRTHLHSGWPRVAEETKKE
jgi:hypothetical protein